MTLPKEVASRDLATILGVTDRRVRQLADQGVIPRAGPRLYPLFESVQAYLRWRFKAEIAGAAGDANRPTNRVADARAREIELRISEREARLIETDRALEIVDDIVSIYRAAYAGFAARATEDETLRRKIDAEVDAVQARVEAALKQRAAFLRQGRRNV